MAAPLAPTVLETLVTRLALLLPHDHASREEAIVGVALAAAGARDPLVGPHQRRLVTQTISAIQALLDRAIHSGELHEGGETLDLAERIHVVVEGYLLDTAASGNVTSRRAEQQFQGTLTDLCAPNPAR